MSSARLTGTSLLGICLLLVFSLLPARPPVVRAAHSTAPASVTLAGDLQQELGCAMDWAPACAATHLSDQGNGVWLGSFSVPAGSWQYKLALNDSWDESYAGNHTMDGNTTLDLSAAGGPTSVRFYYDHKTHAVLDSRMDTIATAAGTFQSELGCFADWLPGCLRSLLSDADGDGIYQFVTTAIPAGSYQFKLVLNEGSGNWYPENNLPFSVPVNGAQVTISYNAATYAVNVDVQSTGASHDNNIRWTDLGHNSREPFYRSPGGAVTAGTTVVLRLRAAANDLTAARVRIWDDRQNVEAFMPMSFDSSDGTYDWWKLELATPADPTIYWYRFIAVDGTATAYYEDDAARTGGWGQTSGSSQDISWQLTLYDPSFQTPEWVKHATIYQIFPDRFRDGNPANNTPAGTPFYESQTIGRSNATGWNTPVCDPRDAGGPCPGVWSENFYGGDLQGIVDQLDYIESLGVTALYLNPIFESPSNHKYDTSDFSQVDDNFGDLATFQMLTAQAHARGMRVILDGVFNHSSSDSIYFDRYGRYPTLGACESAASPYRDWYFFQSVPSGSCAGQSYESWFGYDSLPKLNSSNPEVRDLFWAGEDAIAPGWIALGADGWRLDVGADVDPGVTNDLANTYWEGFRDAVRTSTYSQTYIVGEEWGNASPWLLGQEWDATMNYQLSSALLSFWRDEAFVDNDHNSGSSAGALSPLSPTQLDERLRNLQERYPPEAFYAMMNLLGSHDTNRALFMLDHNADQNSAALYQNPSYDWSDAISRLRGVVLLQMTLPGAPTIYYGDEAGLVGPVAYDGSTWQDDPYNRQPFPWLDQDGTPFYTHLQSAAGQDSLRDYYRLLTTARAEHPALRTGSFDTLLADDAARVYAYGRLLPDLSDAALVVTNRDNSVTRTITLDLAGYLPIGTQLVDALDGNQPYTVGAASQLSLTLAARQGALLVLAAPVTAPPQPVADLAVTGHSPGALTLGWSAASGATSYDIYRLIGGQYSLVGNTGALTYADSGLTNGQRYYYVVASRNDSSGLTSAFSNQASGIPSYDLSSAWYNLQYPFELTHTIVVTAETALIYGQLYIAGATGNQGGPAQGILAQVGYGPLEDEPTAASWRWRPMHFNTLAGNNDEYAGRLLPDVLGDYAYATRYSSDGGATWYYADRDGPLYTSGRGGLLHVVAGADTTPPQTPPNLRVGNTTTGSISLLWDASAGPGLAGYEVFRRPAGSGGYVRVGVVDALTTSFEDLDVSAGASYDYYVLAFDQSFNRSAPSNLVQAIAEPRLVALSISVSVPSPTPGSVYIAGDHVQIGSWNPGAVPLTQLDATTWSITRTLLHGTALEFKFTRGNWETVEKAADGNSEIANRTLIVDYDLDGTQQVSLTVAAWRDPLVAGHSPLDGAGGLPLTSTVVVSWSQQMQAITTIALHGPGGPVVGNSSLDASGRILSFTPAQPLVASTTYTATATGAQDAGGDAQQVPVRWSFQTAQPLLSFAQAGAMVDEGAGTLSVTVRLSAPSSQPASVRYQSVAGTAGQGDYLPISGTLTFEPGQTELPIVITLLDDWRWEPGESLSLVLDDAGGASLTSQTVFTLAIRDDDRAILLPLLRRTG